MKSGFVSIVGRPNVGKSSLINALMQSKVSIVSSHPAITRIKVLGVYNADEGQIIFLDTPGFEKNRSELSKSMSRTIFSCVEDSDIVLFLIDAKGWQEYDEKILESIKKYEKKIILVINKADILDRKEFLLPLIESSFEKHDFLEVIPLSATRKNNVNGLLKAIFKHLPRGEKIFPDDMKTNIPLEYEIAEIIREKIVNSTYQEVPQSIAVAIEELKPGNKDKKMIAIKAAIIIDRENIKPIIIGKNGEKLKAVGSSARKEIEALLGKKVFLELWVKTVKDWKNRPDIFRGFGYGNF
ncbi:MAG TPA: GTPase Era [bacterium]|nr:GTPase Era [bacterium]